MAGQAGLEHLVVDIVGRAHQRHAGHLQLVDGAEQVFGEHRDVLDALAVELHQELFDLIGLARGAFVERDADLAVGRRHRLGGEAGVFALDVEIADLAEIEEALVEGGPVGHAAVIDVVGQVVDLLRP